MTKRRGASRPRRFVVASVVVALLGVAFVAAPSATRPATAADAADTTTMTNAMLGIESGIAGSASSELFGWTMTALGINSSGGNLEIEGELAQINTDLVNIDTELNDIDGELELQTCELDAAETTFDATTQIGTLNTDLEQFQNAGVTESQATQFVENVLDSDTDSIPYQLTAINQALLDSGTIPGVISSCLATVDTPTDGTGGDTDYYQNVTNLLAYFYGYQVEGLNLVVEAYHALAANAYFDANPTATVTADTLDTICSLASDNTDVAIYCNDAVYWVSVVYQNLQEQYSFGGAPYSVEGQSLTVNGTPYVFAQSLEAYTEAQTDECDSPLDSSDPCGPLAGTNVTASIESPSTYAWRTDWQVASAEQWRAAVDWWTDSSQTLGTYLGDLGFENTTNSTKIILTDTTYQAEPEAVIDGSEQDIFSLPAVCFLDTGVERTHAHQPWCYNGSSDGVDYGDSSDLVSDLSGGDCSLWSAPSYLTDADTNDFFQGTYEHSDGCSKTEWVDGIQPGWILDANNVSVTQYLWPVFDMSAASCNTNVNGSSRSTTNVQGVYTMCGDDFDLWFEQLVPTPEVLDATPDASVTSTTSGGSTTVTTGAWDTDTTLTVTANSEPLVLDHTKTDFSGTLRKTYAIPAELPVGAHTVTLDGVHNGQPYTVTVPFTISAVVPRFTG